MESKNDKMKLTEAMLVDDAAIIQVYEDVLSGKLKQFPPYTWELPNSLYYANVIVRYLFEVKLKWDEEEIKEQYDTDFLKKYRLVGMQKALFGQVFNVIDSVYPGKIKAWELKTVPRGFWDSDDHKKDALEWLIEKKLGWDMEQVKKQLTSHVFRKHGLGGLFQRKFENSTYKAINFLYPDQIKPWEMHRVGNEYWTPETKKEALVWLFHEQLENDVEVIKNLTVKTFEKYRLNGLLQAKFQSSPIKAIEYIYGDLVKAWELNKVGKHYWSQEEHIEEALKWLFETKLQWNPKEIDEQLTLAVFEKNGLGGLMGIHFNDSPYQAASFLYPTESFEILKRKQQKNFKNGSQE